MEQQPPTGLPTTLAQRLAKLLEDFTARQNSERQAAIAKALGVVNEWLSRLQKK